ncbi:hypothetical protein BDF22DRAFT_695736 [Syncephalis plumigaleata]|nr:hypothetical protein BDF22DRAFT_695736 [Syncephalis plumigaleata]
MHFKFIVSVTSAFIALTISVVVALPYNSLQEVIESLSGHGILEPWTAIPHSIGSDLDMLRRTYSVNQFYEMIKHFDLAVMNECLNSEGGTAFIPIDTALSFKRKEDGTLDKPNVYQSLKQFYCDDGIKVDRSHLPREVLTGRKGYHDYPVVIRKVGSQLWANCAKVFGDPVVINRNVFFIVDRLFPMHSEAYLARNNQCPLH